MEEDAGAYRPVTKWSTDEVVSWMKGLHKSLEDHIPQFLAHCICGSDLLKLTQQQLEYLKVTQLGHQELLLEAVEMLSALEKGRSQDFTFSLASTLSKKTSQLIHAISLPSSKKPHQQQGSDSMEASLHQSEIAADVMMAAKLMLSWLDRNPSSLVKDYENFRMEVLESAQELSSIMDDYDVPKMLELCRKILKCSSIMMSPQNMSSMEPIKMLMVKLQPREDSGLGFSIHRTRQGNLVVNNVVAESPASESGVIVAGVEIVQINNQNVVGWEMNKVIKTLKASGHQVTLVINTSSTKPSFPMQQTSTSFHNLRHPEGEDRQDQVLWVRNGDDTGKFIDPFQYESCDDSLSSQACQSADPRMNNCYTMSYSDWKSSSQDTLDDIDESADSFVEDSNFSCMEGNLKVRMPTDLHRTSSAPLVGSRELEEADVEVSPECGYTVVKRRDYNRELSLASKTTGGSLKGLKDTNDSGIGLHAFKSRLKMRTSSDGTMEKLASGYAEKPKNCLPPVAYRTQIVGGVVVRVPIKPEDQDKSNQKKRKHSHQRSRHKKGHRKHESGDGVGGTKEGAGSCDVVGVAGEASVTGPMDGEEGTDKVKAVFSECKEVTIGGQTTKQVTVSSSTEIIGGKKTSNPALMVPCFQLKDTQKEGFMSKLGGSGFTPKNWRRRWFVLKDKKLYYYKTSFDIAALGIVNMTGYVMENSQDKKKQNVFRAIKEGSRTYHFQTETSDELTSWMEHLTRATEGGYQDEQGTIEASDDEL